MATARRSLLRRRSSPVVVAALAVAAAATLLTGRPSPSFAPAGSSPGARARAGAALRRCAAPAGTLLRPVAAAAASDDSASWNLPSVDKDISDFYAGRANSYAWVQTSDTIFLFAPLLDDSRPDVQLTLENEGTMVSLTIEGKSVLSGRMAHAWKPGSDIWMVEKARDGTQFVVVEGDKLTPGIEWTSILEPEVVFSDSYSTNLRVELPAVTAEQEEEALADTLLHLQRKHATLESCVDAHAAQVGNVLEVAMQGYELTADGARGAPFGDPAKELQLELGAPGPAGAGLRPEVHQQLVGIKLGETRDVQVTLGQRAGGKTILLSVECTRLRRQALPGLDDGFAKTVKRADQLVQAGTAEGVPHEEKGLGETFTMEQLRGEILNEVRWHSQEEARNALHRLMEAQLLKATEVRCEWGSPKGGLGEPEAAARQKSEEDLAATLLAVAEREGLLRNVDNDKVERETWDVLGTPKPGDTNAEVGSDPAREFQEAKRKVFRKSVAQEVLGWLETKAEVVMLDAA